MDIHQTIHRELKFTGRMNRTFTFEDKVYDDDYGWSKLESKISIRDNALYINGIFITRNQEAIETFCHAAHYYPHSYPLQDWDDKKVYIYATFSIDASGYIICTYSNRSTSKFDKFIGRWIEPNLR